MRQKISQFKDISWAVIQKIYRDSKSYDVFLEIQNSVCFLLTHDGDGILVIEEGDVF